MKKIIKKHSYTIFLCSAILFFILVGGLLTFTPLGDVSEANGQPAKIMDSQYIYEADFVFSTFEALGENGRNEYTNFHIIDYFFLASYCLFMIAVTKPFALEKAKKIFIIFPLLPAVCDVIENTLIEIASASFPNISNTFATVISFFTTIKWSLGVLWFGVFITLAIIFIIKKFKMKSK